MKYMIMMFGSAAGMAESQSPEWITEMIGFMKGLDGELKASGELVYADGLTDASTALTVHRTADGVQVTDGPFAESKESIIGFWIVDVADEQRVLDISGRIVRYSQVVEVRRVGDAPPDF